jgi:hypothetical protein
VTGSNPKILHQELVVSLESVIDHRRDRGRIHENKGAVRAFRVVEMAVIDEELALDRTADRTISSDQRQPGKGIGIGEHLEEPSPEFFV